jgi:hypothetical protein
MTRPPDKKQELIERLTKLWNETAGLSHEETIDRLADFILVRDASITSEVSTNTSLDTEGLEKRVGAIKLPQTIVYSIHPGLTIGDLVDTSLKKQIIILLAQHTQAAVEANEAKHQQVYKWLLGETGHFSLSATSKYGWRRDLRRVLEQQKKKKS